MKNLLTFLIIILLTTSLSAQKFTISGVIQDNATGEELIGANVYVSELKTGTVCNVYGFYSITLNKGTYNLAISFLGYETKRMSIDLNEDKKLDFHLVPTSKSIEEVKVIGEKKNENVSRVEMSTNQLQIRTIQRIPALMGETDVIKSIQLLPGVQSGGEGTTGFYVRGGNVDQNLILLDDATVYNASHMFGFFSVFNQDAVKDVKLYKGGIPAEFGGRLSSLLDIRMKEGNSRQFAGSGGIGIVSSRLTVEGPIVKDKSSFLISGRRTYFDLAFPFLSDTTIRKSAAYFYDLNAKLNYTINENNRIFISGYFGNDVTDIAKQIKMIYGNGTFTFRYNHLFTNKLFSNLTVIYSKFNYSLGTPDGPTSFNWNSNIIDQTVKNDYNWFVNPNNTVKFGFAATYHTFKPGYANKNSDQSFFNDLSLPFSYAIEYDAFMSNEQKIGEKITLQYGLRFSMFQSIGKATVYKYDASDLKEYTVKDSTKYGSNEIYNSYPNFEPRFNLVYKANESTSIKASYNRMTQYIHLATNTTASTPLDVWFPSSPNVKPQIADQVALGIFKNLHDNLFETSVEVYYKKMDNVIDFKDHAQLFLNKKFEGELRFGKGQSYGVELFVKKQEGALTGWISYTWSRTLRTIPEINNGNEFAAPYDKPHNISVVLSYEITPRINVSANWVYSTGAPRTVPVGKYTVGNVQIPMYSDRNSVRIPDYHRLDISLTIDAKRNKKDGTPKKFYGSWNFSVYNVYNRHNAYSVTFQSIKDVQYATDAQKLYLF